MMKKILKTTSYIGAIGLSAGTAVLVYHGLIPFPSIEEVKLPSHTYVLKNFECNISDSEDRIDEYLAQIPQHIIEQNGRSETIFIDVTVSTNSSNQQKCAIGYQVDDKENLEDIKQELKKIGDSSFVVKTLPDVSCLKMSIPYISSLSYLASALLWDRLAVRKDEMNRSDEGTTAILFYNSNLGEKAKIELFMTIESNQDFQLSLFPEIEENIK